MHYLASTPLTRDWMCAQTIGREAVEGVHDFVVTGSIFCDESVSFFSGHRVGSLFVCNSDRGENSSEEFSRQGAKAQRLRTQGKFLQCIPLRLCAFAGEFPLG